MTTPQLIALLVLVSTVALLIRGRMRPEIVALSGAAVLLITRTIRPVEVESAFASPAIIALASLFVIVYAMELTGLLGLLIRLTVALCERFGRTGLWILIVFAGAASAFVNNSPIVVLTAPVVRDAARSMGVSAKRFLIPLSYATILGGTCTLIGTSTNLLVNDMARNAGQPAFSLFEVTPVAVCIAAAGGLYLLLVGNRLLGGRSSGLAPSGPPQLDTLAAGDDPDLVPRHTRFNPLPGTAAGFVFLAVIFIAGLNIAPIAAAAFAGAVFLIVSGVISADDAYRGLRPEVLLLIAGMVVIGLSLEVTGLAAELSRALQGLVASSGPAQALAIFYGLALFLTEVLSNAAVAVLLTPIAVALAETMDVSARPFLVALMIAASAAFATPFGYQTNVLVYQMGKYSYMDFIRIGVPLNLLTWALGVYLIPLYFPF